MAIAPIAPPPKPRSQISRAMRGGELKIRALGIERRFSSDIYYSLMRLSWARLFALFTTLFLTFNLGFAGLYSLDQRGLSVSGGGDLPAFWRDFFFSVHTVATIGYGNVYPVSLWANMIVVIEITLGLITFALATGIAFARFSRPTARILFSKILVVRDVEGVPTLMLRAANQRHNMIYSAEVRVSLLVDQRVGSTMMRRFVDLTLERDRNPAFALTWTVIHRIDADSPLRGWLADRAAAMDDEIIVVLSGIDEISGQTIHGRWAYSARDVAWGARFADIVSSDAGGARTINYRLFHEVMRDDG